MIFYFQVFFLKSYSIEYWPISLIDYRPNYYSFLTLFDFLFDFIFGFLFGFFLDFLGDILFGFLFDFFLYVYSYFYL